MRNTLFNLAPRGFGLTSFRLYEYVVQMNNTIRSIICVKL